MDPYHKKTNGMRCEFYERPELLLVVYYLLVKGQEKVGEGLRRAGRT